MKSVILVNCANSTCDEEPVMWCSIRITRWDREVEYQLAVCEEHRDEAQKLVDSYECGLNEEKLVEWSRL